MEGQSIRYFFLLLFLLHFRSGSSLTGKILSANPDSFYLYEPYHRNLFKYSNGSGVILDFEQVDENIVSNFTNNLFGCQKVS